MQLLLHNSIVGAEAVSPSVPTDPKLPDEAVGLSPVHTEFGSYLHVEPLVQVDRMYTLVGAYTP